MIGTPPEGHVLAPGTDTGPCAVFVHGIEDSWRTWTRLARCLGTDWRAVALGLPWRAGNDYLWRWGGSPGDWLRAGLDALADDRPYVLVGHSFGANAVLSRLAAGEHRATAAVLAAPFFRPAEATVNWRTFELSREAFERQISDGMRMRMGMGMGMGMRSMPHADIFETMLARTCERIGPVGFLAVFEQYVASGHLPLSHVDIPVLVLIGEEDPGMFRPHMEALASRLRRATIASGPEYDHFCHIRHALEVARAIDELAAATVNPGQGG